MVEKITAHVEIAAHPTGVVEKLAARCYAIQWILKKLYAFYFCLYKNIFNNLIP